MQVKVFKFDKNGKVSFTQAELEKLLNEVYTGGYNDGKRANNYWTWTSPYWTWSNTYSNSSNSNITLTGTDTTSTNPNITWTTTTNSTDATVTASMYTDDDNAVKINDNVTYTVDTSCLNNYKK